MVSTFSPFIALRVAAAPRLAAVAISSATTTSTTRPTARTTQAAIDRYESSVEPGSVPVRNRHSSGGAAHLFYLSFSIFSFQCGQVDHIQGQQQSIYFGFLFNTPLCKAVCPFFYANLINMRGKAEVGDRNFFTCHISFVNFKNTNNCGLIMNYII